MKRIDCLSIEALGSRVRYLTWGNRTWTLAFAAGKILPTIICFFETKPIPRKTVLEPDLAYDVIIQRLETPRPPKPVYRPVPMDTSPAVPFV